MLKYTVLFSAVFYLANSQRPWHAGSSNRLPMVLPQYIDERIAAEQASLAAAAGQTVQSGQPVQTIQPKIGVQLEQAYPLGQAKQPVPGVQGCQGALSYASADAGLSNRIGEGSVNNVPFTTGPAVYSTTFATTTINPADLPVDANGDVDLVNRIKTWPREKQPFWYLNWQAIQAHRGDVNNSAQVPQVQPNAKSFFAG